MTSFFFLFLRAAMRRVDFSTIEAARSLGAGEWTILRRVVLPVILPTLLAVILLTVYGAVGSFAAPQILGGRDFHMLSQVILTLNSLRRQDMAALLALLMGVVVMGLILLSQYYEAKGSYVGGSKTPVPIQLRRMRNPLANAALHGIAWLMALLYILPVGLVILFSFAPAASIGVETLPSSLTLKNYIRVFTEGRASGPAWNSARMGLIAVADGAGDHALRRAGDAEDPGLDRAVPGPVVLSALGGALDPAGGRHHRRLRHAQPADLRRGAAGVVVDPAGGLHGGDPAADGALPARRLHRDRPRAGRGGAVDGGRRAIPVPPGDPAHRAAHRDPGRRG